MATSTRRTTQSRKLWIDIIRGSAVLCVVLYHSVIALKVADIATPAWGRILNEALSPFRMPMLMFLSGLLLERSLLKPTRQFITGKLRHIAWPYLIWTTVIIVFLIGSSQFAGDGNYGVNSIGPLIVDPATYTWYLAYLLAYYLLSLLTPANIRTAMIPALLALSVIAPDQGGVKRFAFLYVFFLIGDLTARKPDVWQSIIERLSVRLVSAIAVVGLVWYAVVSENGLRYSLLSALAVLGACVLCQPVGSAVSKVDVVSRPLRAIGRDSIVYYVTHWIVVTATVNVMDVVHFRQPSLALIILIVLGVAVPAVVVLLQRRFPVIRALYVFPEVPARKWTGTSGSEPDVVEANSPSRRSRLA